LRKFGPTIATRANPAILTTVAARGVSRGNRGRSLAPRERSACAGIRRAVEATPAEPLAGAPKAQIPSKRGATVSVRPENHCSQDHDDADFQKSHHAEEHEIGLAEKHERPPPVDSQV
jgi:hypothetical protein